MSISCNKIFLLVSRFLSLWPWPSLELAIIEGICVAQTDLVFFRNLPYILARTVSHRRSSWTTKHANVILIGRHVILSPYIRFFAYSNSFIPSHDILFLVSKVSTKRTQGTQWTVTMSSSSYSVLSFSIKTAVTFWYSSVFKSSIRLGLFCKMWMALFVFSSFPFFYPWLC